MSDLISRQAVLDALDKHCDIVCKYSKKQRSVMCGACPLGTAFDVMEELPSAQPQQIVRCKDCKHNPKLEWFGCPMSHLNEKQRPETAWCWKGERKDDE